MESQMGRDLVLVIRGVAMLTPRVLRLAMKAALKVMKTAAKAVALPFKVPGAIKQEISEYKNAEHHGKQTVKQLARQNKGLQSIEVSKDTIGNFNKVARKYGVDFAPYKVKGENTFMVFFKGPDVGAMTAAFEEYTKKLEKKAEKVPLRQRLAQRKKERLAAKEKVPEIKPPVKAMPKGPEL